jgi:hypothetical protein
MRHLHIDSHCRLAIAVLQDSDLYVDTLLGLARDHIRVRQRLISRGDCRARGNLGRRIGSAER